MATEITKVILKNSGDEVNERLGDEVLKDDLPMGESGLWTKKRLELSKWFNDNAPSFEDGYKGAVELLNDPTFPGRIHFICHAVRDIYRYLPAALKEKTPPRPGEVFPGMVQKFTERWNKNPPKIDKEDGEIMSIRMHEQVYRQAKEIVSKSNNMKKNPSSVENTLVKALLRAHDRHNSVPAGKWIYDTFKGEYKYFVERAHFNSKELMPTNDELVSRFEAFERAFHSLVGPYFSGKEEIDDILRDTNPAAS